LSQRHALTNHRDSLLTAIKFAELLGSPRVYPDDARVLDFQAHACMRTRPWPASIARASSFTSA
jgi:hypothetical protein